MMTARSAYIHIPFCAHKCHFCDFAAFAGLSHLEDQYCQIVCQEIVNRAGQLPAGDRLINSVFFGGGTPGLISPANIDCLLRTLANNFQLNDKIEISLETTPQAITIDKAKAWLNAGINRLSIGIESFNDHELEQIGRNHSRQEALVGINTAQKAGFANINCDLIYGLPSQTLTSWQESLSTLLKFNLPHLSAYGLEIATNSPLTARFPLGSPSYPDETACEDMYITLIEMAENAGLKQYEISNFAHPGIESRHNLHYWLNGEYHAFGVSAHRYVNGIRSANWRSMNRYMNDFSGHEKLEPIDQQTKLREAMFLALRTVSGINLKHFLNEHGVNLQQKLADKIHALSESGFLKLQSGHLSLTRKGFFVSNLVIAELI